VHMLSHMVGASNRIDIARLRNLERELGKRDDKIARQEVRLRTAALERADLLQRIAKLEVDLACRAVLEAPPPLAVQVDEAAVLVRKLDGERAHSAGLVARLRQAEEELQASQRTVGEYKARETSLQKELAALERELVVSDGDEGIAAGQRLVGRKLLYVGGRSGQLDKLKVVAERQGGKLLAHDGGVHDNAALLPGLISQAEVAFFPVDCISHNAAGQLKKLCREAGKPFVPLRTASVASFVAALRSDSLFEHIGAAAG
jgi:hypothetical protein